MNFEFIGVPPIVFGNGSVGSLGRICKSFGKRALVVTGGSVFRATPAFDSLLSSGLSAVNHVLPPGEPSAAQVAHAVAVAKDEKCDFVVGFGGGAAMDLAKAVSVLVDSPYPVEDFAEVVGKGRSLDEVHPIPCVTIPTTAGSGAEVTRNAVISFPEHRLKASLRHSKVLPRLALVDPYLALSLPPDVTAYTGMDALAQLIEPYVSVRANSFIDSLCVGGMELVRKSLQQCVDCGAKDLKARGDMALASLMSGIALSNTGLGAVHGFAAAIGGMYERAPHGAICAALLPSVMERNILSLEKRNANSPALEKYRNIARILTGRHNAKRSDCVKAVMSLCHSTGISSLSNIGVRREDFSAIVAIAKTASSMKPNPIVLTDSELIEILERAF